MSNPKYLHQWNDSTPKQQHEATQKAIKAYDVHESWDRTTDQIDDQFRKYRAEKRAKGVEIVSLDCIVVRDAKIKNGQLVGKVKDKTKRQLINQQVTTV